MNFSLKRSQRGISLLEIMLSLAIITIILVIATRFFLVTNTNSQANNAYDQVIGIRGAATNFLNDSPSGTLSIANLVSGGYLPKSYGGAAGDGKGANPWSGDLAAAAGTKARTYTVTVSSVPSGACTILRGRLEQNLNTNLNESISAATECGDNTTGSVTVTYYR